MPRNNILLEKLGTSRRVQLSSISCKIRNIKYVCTNPSSSKNEQNLHGKEKERLVQETCVKDKNRLGLGSI